MSDYYIQELEKLTNLELGIILIMGALVSVSIIIIINLIINLIYSRIKSFFRNRRMRKRNTNK